jgi:winged helix-turn-helix protein
MSFRARGCRGEPGWRTHVSFISKQTGVTFFHQQANWCYQLAWQCFDLAIAHKLNVMGNAHTAKARFMRLHEEFGLSVSDDTIYRALKDLGFSHVSARPKAYKQNAEAMNAFKKTSPSMWRKSARSSHPTHR